MLVDQAESLRSLVRDRQPPPEVFPAESSDSLTPPGVVPVQSGPADDHAGPTHRGKRAHLIAIASGKGGVGKTTIAVNLAVKLTQMGRKVLLLDADLGTANADVLLDLGPSGNLAHVVAGRLPLRDAIIQAPGGFGLIPGASGLAQMAALGELERHRLIEQLHELEREVDLILVDTGAGVGPNVLGFAVAADHLLVVTTPEPTAVTDAYAAIKTAVRQREDLDVRILVNMVKDKHEGRAVFERIAGVCRRFLDLSPRYAGHVVLDARVSASIRRRRPFVMESPSCEASGCLAQLAHRIDRHASEPSAGGVLRRVALWLGA
jgi:flagellar biosynthesis protein FlhG